VPIAQFFPHSEIDIAFDDIRGTFRQVQRVGQVMVFDPIIYMKAKESNESLFAMAMIAIKRKFFAIRTKILSVLGEKPALFQNGIIPEWHYSRMALFHLVI
jgi:hypothetical protein